ncbi:hypothetical protein CANCADRAFT_29955 [Tortispora caseinolytica NRRL Y-17796]|uniref:MICOS complex subunit n=1 Tax=Tortispora caseinolytica NRRL Y-17796 TaxID=767744 RepID=A0A1E4TIH9_9ASCO|nr:hypothetical protein CANCADRAFT_29955 [Tortispora caseinolytica NRRL Y-17796]
MKPFYDEEVPAAEPVEATKVEPLAPGAPVHAFVKPEQVPNLMSSVHQARLWTAGKLQYAENKIDSWVSSFISTEKKTTAVIAGLKDREEPLLSSAVYIIVAGLSGSIFARARSFPVRFLAPPVFATTVFAYTMPNTFANTKTLLWNIEKEHAPPSVIEAQLQADSAIKNAAVQTEEISQQATSKVTAGVSNVRKFIAKTTGLKVD